MVLALTAANTLYLGSRQDTQPQPQNIQIKVMDNFTITLPGEGLTVDFSAPGGVRVFSPNGSVEREDRFLTDQIRQMRPSDFIAIAVEIAVILVLFGVALTVARYVAETAVIRMVNETEESGRQLSLRQGLHLGWSGRAARLFLIDLLAGLAFAAILSLALPLSIGSIMLAEPLGAGAIVMAAFGVLGLLSIAGLLLVALAAVVSLIMQPVRRACVIDGMGVFASIGAGVAMLRRHLKDVGITWLIWIGIRILWAPVSLVVAVILLPVLLASVLAGMVAGASAGGLAGAIAAPFVHGPTAWIIGAIAGLPVFVLVVILPLLFIAGWVEIYKSSLWTLAYRELRGVEGALETARPNRPLAPAQGVAD
jgi:hypothetical protein